MTGSGRNASSHIILIGMAIAENSNGDLLHASTNNPAFALATSNAGPGAILNYATEGLTTRTDWTPIIASRYLTVGKPYYVGKNGALALTGTQQIGTARSKTYLRIAISAPQAKPATLWPVTGRPKTSMGAEGDFAYDSVRAAFYGPKKLKDWGPPSHMVRAAQMKSKPLRVYRGHDGYWSWVPHFS